MKALSRLEGIEDFFCSSLWGCLLYYVFSWVKTAYFSSGVDSVDIDVAMQKVTVMGWANQHKVLKAVRKDGRMAELWPFPYNPEFHDYYAHYYGNGSYDYLYSDAHTAGENSPVNYPMAQPKPSSSYNYRMHGYNGHQHGYYQEAPYAAILDTDATSIFSDDNATGCSVM